MLHAICIEEGVEVFAPLVAALAAKGWRVGWLELEAPPAIDLPLEAALNAGAFRAVAVGGNRARALKSMKGAPVLADVLREYFKGCRLVLVLGQADLPRLRSRAGEWDLVTAGGVVKPLSTVGLVRALGRPKL